MAKKAIICPRCKHLVGSNENVCSWCGASRANPWWKAMGWTRNYLGEDQVVSLIIIVNIVFYALSLLLSQRLSLSANPLHFLAPGNYSLVLLGASGTLPVDQFGRYWTFLSASYLHGGILHIFFNMMALKQIAPGAIREYGSSRMFAIYTIGGIGGYILSYLAGVPLTIGASAAICALIGALLYYGKSRGGTYGSMVYREVIGWLIGLFLFGFLVPGINNWGHIGGILSGILLGILLGYNERKKETPFHRNLALMCGLATAVCLAWAAFGATYIRLIH
jgi:membrane associated rhomboid family serine protease